MVKKQKVQVAEMQRRKAQANKDKRASMAKQVVPKSVTVKPSQKTRPKTQGLPSYAKLVLDPCNSVFAESNMPGQAGGQQVRLPFRQMVYTPTATMNLVGGSTTGATACDTLIAILTPHAMNAASGPQSLGCFSVATENSATGASCTGNVWSDPVGLATVNGYSGEMRPVSACIRITCMASDTANSGFFFGYEGPARQFIAHNGDDTTSFLPQTTAQQMFFNGQTSQDTYKTYEVRINYPNADPEWQEWRQVTGATSAAAGVARSGDASDPDWSDMPIAICGVSSATPGAKYLIDGAIVYEWLPKVTIGIPAPPKKPSNANALGSAAQAVQKVANGWGGMLISSAVNYATGGNSSAVLGILREGYAAYTNAKKKTPW